MDYAGLDLDIVLIRMVEDEWKIRKFMRWKGSIQPRWNLLVHNNAYGFTTKTFK